MEESLSRLHNLNTDKCGSARKLHPRLVPQFHPPINTEITATLEF